MLDNIELLDPDYEDKYEKEEKKRKIKFKQLSRVETAEKWFEFRKAKNEKKLKSAKKELAEVRITQEEAQNENNRRIDKLSKTIARLEKKLFFLDYGVDLKNDYVNSRALQLRERMYNNLEQVSDYIYKIELGTLRNIFKDEIDKDDIKRTVDDVFNKKREKESEEKGGESMSLDNESMKDNFDDQKPNVTGNESRIVKPNKFLNDDGEYHISKDDIDNPDSWIESVSSSDVVVDSRSMWNDQSRDMPNIPGDRTTFNYNADAYKFGQNVENARTVSDFQDAIKRARELYSEREKALAEQQREAAEAEQKDQKYRQKYQEMQDYFKKLQAEIDAIKSGTAEIKAHREETEQFTSALDEEMQGFDAARSTGGRRK